MADGHGWFSAINDQVWRINLSRLPSAATSFPPLSFASGVRALDVRCWTLDVSAFRAPSSALRSALCALRLALCTALLYHFAVNLQMPPRDDGGMIALAHDGGCVWRRRTIRRQPPGNGV